MRFGKISPSAVDSYGIIVLDRLLGSTYSGVSQSTSCQNQRKSKTDEKMGPFSEQKCRYDEEDGQTGSITGVILAQQFEACRLGTSKLPGCRDRHGISFKYWLGRPKMGKRANYEGELRRIC